MNFLKKVLMADTTALRWQMAWLGVFFMFGLLFMNTAWGAYYHMLHIAPVPVWAAAFGVYAVGRFYTSAYAIPKAPNLCISLLGFTLWTVTLLSFLHNPQRSMGAADLMIAMPLVCEVWIGADLWSLNKNERK